jgi:hypothetical protein
LADNVEITAGSGTPIATDDVGGVQYQVVKWDAGVDGAAAPALSTFMASASDGSTPLTSDAQAVKGSEGKVYGYYIYNPNSIAQFVHFYDVAAASVTVGTTAPKFTLTIPPTSAANLMGPFGVGFDDAISVAATDTAGGPGAPNSDIDAVIWYA